MIKLFSPIKSILLLVILGLVCAKGFAAAPADSTSTNRVNASQVTPYAPAHFMDSTRVDYKDMIPCPGDPTATAATSWWPTSPICPNINGGYRTAAEKTTAQGRIGQILPGSNPIRVIMPSELYCPAQCTVTQRVVKSGSTITDVQRAICPDDYIAVGSYNMQNEVRYITAAEAAAKPLPFPVTSENYTKYTAAGYPCTLDYSTEEVGQSVCKGSPGLPAQTEVTFTPGVNLTVVVYGSRGEGMAQYFKISHGSACYDNTNCGGPTSPACTGAWDCTDTTNTNYQRCWTSGLFFSNYYYYSFAYLRCSLPSNRYIEDQDRQSPASLVCVRAQKVWDKGNQ